MSEGMEKYGVDEEKDVKEKSASSEPARCPDCDTQVEKHGSVKKCPVHGTEPFEKD